MCQHPLDSDGDVLLETFDDYIDHLICSAKIALDMAFECADQSRQQALVDYASACLSEHTMFIESDKRDG